ncbi:hypothetical protein NEAUS03_0181 [Nematocida ausubeli]|nr:hypothetical protein NEAUS03_0181 [Nematocida ausubeli]
MEDINKTSFEFKKIMNNYNLDVMEGKHRWVYGPTEVSSHSTIDTKSEQSTEKHPMLEKNKTESSKKNFCVRFFCCFRRCICRSCLTLLWILLAALVLIAIFLIVGYFYSPSIKNMILILYAEISKSARNIWEATKNIKLTNWNGTYFTSG